MKKRYLISGFFFILMITSVIIARDNPVLFDFNIIHNFFGLNVIYHKNAFNLAWIIGLISILITLIYGPVFCGYICPFGSLQRILGHMGQVLGIKKIKLKKLHSPISILKYLILGYFVYLIVIEDVWTYINVDPYHAFIRLFYGGITVVGGLYLIIVILMSLWTTRPFCNYLCPYGAGINLLSSMRLVKINRVDSVCIQCKKCDHTCPVQIKITEKETIKDVDCLSCNKCIEVCPKAGAIKKAFHPFGIIVLVVVMALALYLSKPIAHPSINETFTDDTNDKLTVSEPLEEAIDLVEPLPLKETSTVDIYFDYSVDLLPTSLAKSKNSQALKAYEEKLAAEREAKRIEAERLAKEKAEAERIAQEKAEAEKLAKEKEEADRLAEEQKNQSSGVLYYDGTYKATVNAFSPDMTVQVVIKNDTIMSIEIIEHNETNSYYNYAAPKMINKILTSNSTDVSIIAGATYTSIGIRNGVKTCLLKARK